MVLVHCLNMACQNAMLKKGAGAQWRPLVYSDLPRTSRSRLDYTREVQLYTVEPLLYDDHHQNHIGVVVYGRFHVKSISFGTF